MAETLTVDIDARGIATITLDQPARHNAMSALMIADLHKAAEVLGTDDSVRAVVLTGAGASFCAGADLGWMKAQMAASPEERAQGARELALMLRALDRLPKPLIGRVNGQAFGGGLGLISVCDIAVAVDTAVFAFSETRLGIIPATIGPYVVARIGAAGARRVFFSARRFSAGQAVDLGLLARAVPAPELDEAIAQEVGYYLDCAPGAVAAAKALLAKLTPPIDDALIELTAGELVARWETQEAVEGISAFFDRRKPSWAGSAESGKVS